MRGGQELFPSKEFHLAQNIITTFFLVTTSSFLIFLIYENFNQIKTWQTVDILNIAFFIGLLFFSKIISFYVDRKSDNIVKLREPQDYSLIRQFFTTLTLSLFSIIYMKIRSDFDIWFIFILFPIITIIHEILERTYPLRIFYIKQTDSINNDLVKSLLDSSSDNAKKFWLREISGNIAKSTINCWIAFVILIVTISGIEKNSFQYEGKNISIDSSTLDITTAFYIAASEMFFNSSGIFPNGDWAKACYFFMHFIGVFLYGVFFVIGVQAFMQASRR